MSHTNLPAGLVSLYSKPSPATRYKHLKSPKERRVRQTRPTRPNLAYHLSRFTGHPITVLWLTLAVTKEDTLTQKAFCNQKELDYYHSLIADSTPTDLSVTSILFYRLHWWPDVNAFDQPLPFLDQPEPTQRRAIANLYSTVDALPDLQVLITNNEVLPAKSLPHETAHGKLMVLTAPSFRQHLEDDPNELLARKRFVFKLKNLTLK